MSDPYGTVGGGLRLKGMKKSKKKKSKSLDTDKHQEAVKEQVQEQATVELTPAQKAYRKVQLEREMERIRKKASLSHKDKVANLNRYLENLSEHHDIPKVSWTK